MDMDNRGCLGIILLLLLGVGQCVAFEFHKVKEYERDYRDRKVGTETLIGECTSRSSQKTFEAKAVRNRYDNNIISWSFTDHNHFTQYIETGDTRNSELFECKVLSETPVSESCSECN
jgi:hypothetical protein